MTIILYSIIGALVIGILFALKAMRDNGNKAADISRQFNELRANYQKMEYKLSTYEQKINDLNSTNQSLQNELSVLMDNPMVNADRVNKRIKK